MTGFQSKRLLARRTDPATSHDAAARVDEFGDAHRAKILRALKSLGEAGAEQIASLCGIESYAIRKRLPELARLGYVRVIEGEIHKTSTGRSERVWVAA
jgi:predicted ArsR family transcriptional regulator